MVTNLALTILGHSHLKVRYHLLARRMDRFFPRRLPAWLPPALGHGATPPAGCVSTLRALPRELKRLGLTDVIWRVRLRKKQTIADLQTTLAAGHPTLIYGRWPSNGVPHVMVAAGHDETEDTWYLLDPGNTQTVFRRWTTPGLLAFWETYWVGPLRIYGQGTMVVVTVGVE